MQIFIFKNKFKNKDGDPDYVIRDLNRKKIGAGWEKTDIHNEIYQSVIINEDDDNTSRY